MRWASSVERGHPDWVPEVRPQGLAVVARSLLEGRQHVRGVCWRDFQCVVWGCLRSLMIFIMCWYVCSCLGNAIFGHICHSCWCYRSAARIHCYVEVTELSTNKQRSLSLSDEGVNYFYLIIKGKITLSFASPEKEKLYIYIYDVITWKFFYKGTSPLPT